MKNLIEVLNEAIALLSPEQIYNRYPHQFFDDRSGKLRGRPPFRESKSGTSFTVFPDNGFYDAGDGFSGSAADYLHSMNIGRWERAKGRDFVEAVRELCTIASIEFPEQELTPEQIEKAAHWERRRGIIGSAIAFCEQVLWTDIGLEARRYLNEERGLSDQDIKTLQLGYFANYREVVKILKQRGFSQEEIKAAGLASPKWNGYITYPWHDDQGRPLTIYGRYHQKHPPEGLPKTLALPGGSTKRSPLYLDKVLANHHREAIFVEGVNDAAVLQTRGETRVLSGVAASFSNEQIEILKRRGITKIYHLGDPDGGGVGGTNSNLQRLTLAGISVFVPPQLPDGLDPDEFVIKYGLEAFHQLISNSEHGFRWKAKQIIATHGTDSDAAIKKVLEEAIAWSRLIPKEQESDLKAFYWVEIQQAIGSTDTSQFVEQLQTIKTQASPVEGIPNWKASELAEYIAYRHQSTLAWNTQIEQWYRYEGKEKGIWSKDDKYYIWQLIQEELKAIALIHQQRDKNGNKPGFSHNLVASIENLLKGSLPVRQWDSIEGLLPLKNGVLNLKTQEFHQHDPKYCLTYCLPYEYNPLATCHPILDWLNQMTGGDRIMVEFFRAHLAAIVRGRSDIQSYLELLGPGGTGKGTLTRLATALVGDQNTVSTTLKNLEENRFDTARIFGAKLVVITDAEKFGGEVSVLKALTGEDKLRFEQKYKQPLDGFYAQSRVIICANEAPQSSDYTSGLARRRQTTYLTNKIPIEKQRNLISINGKGVTGEFAQYLPGLLNWVLAMPPEELERAIREIPTTHPSFTQHKAQVLCETNPIADWLDQAVVYREGWRTNVGMAKRDKDSSSPNLFQCVNQWLYANYAEFCQSSGARPVSLRRFVNLLRDLAVNQLGLMVKKGRDRLGAFFEGLKLRSEMDNDPLLISGDKPPDTLPPGGNGGQPKNPSSPDTPPMPFCDGTVMDGDGTVIAETLARDGCDGSDGLSQKLIQTQGEISYAIAEHEKSESLDLTVLPSQEPPQTQMVTECDGNSGELSHPSSAVTELIDLLTQWETTTDTEFSSEDQFLAYTQTLEVKINGCFPELESICPDFCDRWCLAVLKVISLINNEGKSLEINHNEVKTQKSSHHLKSLKIGQKAIFRGGEVRIERLVNEVVALVSSLENLKQKSFEVAIAHLKPVG